MTEIRLSELMCNGFASCMTNNWTFPPLNRSSLVSLLTDKLIELALLLKIKEIEVFYIGYEYLNSNVFFSFLMFPAVLSLSIIFSTAQHCTKSEH